MEYLLYKPIPDNYNEKLYCISLLKLHIKLYKYRYINELIDFIPYGAFFKVDIYNNSIEKYTNYPLGQDLSISYLLHLNNIDENDYIVLTVNQKLKLSNIINNIFLPLIRND